MNGSLMVLLPRKHSIFAGLVLGALGLCLLGCDVGLQKQLDERRAARYQRAASELRAVEELRTELLADHLKDLPAESVGGRHPLMDWRRVIVDARDVPPRFAYLFTKKAGATDEDKGGDDGHAVKVAENELLLALADHYKGTPTQPAASAASGFAKASEDYWKGASNLSRYTGFLRGYLADADKAAKAASESGAEFVQRPFLAEAAFDLVFLHGARIFQLDNLPPDARITTAFPYWQLAFKFPSHPQESFSDYVTRLCRSSDVRKSCEGIPHEFRPQAINLPYVEWLKGLTETFLANHKDAKVFADVAQRLDTALAEQLKERPDFSENPVLPATYSSRAASTALLLHMSPKTGVALATGIEGDAVLVAETFDGTVPADLPDKAAAKVNELKETPGNQIDFERVVLEAPGDLPGKELVKTLGAFPREVVRQFDLIGRRRADESLRRTGVLLRVPAEDEGATTSYQFKDQAEKTSCGYMGVAGRPPIGRKEPGSYLVVTNDTVRAAKLTRDDATRELSVGDLTLDTTPADKAKLDAWAADNLGIIRLFVDSSYTYTQILELLSGILYACTDLDLLVDRKTDERLTITCGKSSLRDITLVVAICD